MEAVDFQNPFAINRAEHLGEDLYQYFAGANLLGGLLSGKSLVLQGGRGSGKTMYFMYHSYESKKREHYDDKCKRSRILEKETILGVYFKAEPDLVTGFRRKDRNEDWWLKVFGHYFNVTICRAICHIAIDLKESDLATFNSESKICRSICKIFGRSVNDPLTLQHIEDLLETAEDEILLYINNIDKLPEPIISHHSRGMRHLVEMLITDMNKGNLTFHVFVDEFENLELYQQRLINTLIKNPTRYLVFDIGVRKNGFKTPNTLAENEQISPDNDYRPFDLEEEISGNNYDALIKEICSKRLHTVYELRKCQNKDYRLQVDHYLGSYDISTEVNLIVSDRAKPRYLKEIEAQLSKTSDRQKRKKLLDILTRDTNPIINRLNLVLLLQGKSADLIAKELEKFKRGRISKYSDWLHNYELGVVFLLCGDYRQRKKYFGYDTYLQLSSGIPRYFIQLCSYAFEYAHGEDKFNFGIDDKISISAQDKAAHHLSVSKIDEIDTYPPFGHKLKRLTLVLGRVFEQLHKRPRISEPEPNHFHTDCDTILPSSKEVLDSGIMWAIFQQRPLTKIKSAKQPRGYEYHLNHVYAPYFEISYRRKRRLDIAPDDFDKLVDGNAVAVAKVARKLIGKVGLGKLSDLLQWQDLQAYQIDFWSSDENQPDENQQDL